jgi:hypothetical protein
MIMARRIFWIGLLSVSWLTGCGTAAPAGAPDDFALAYAWQEGTLPPPYHYSYLIVIDADGSGTLTLTPDYAGPDVPTWVEPFQLSSEERDALYAALVAQDLLRERWRADPLPPVGGSSASLQITANRRAIALPPFVVAAQQSRVAAMHELVEAQVPEAIWTKLLAQRDAYVAERE